MFGSAHTTTLLSHWEQGLSASSIVLELIPIRAVALHQAFLPGSLSSESLLSDPSESSQKALHARRIGIFARRGIEANSWKAFAARRGYEGTPLSTQVVGKRQIRWLFFSAISLLALIFSTLLGYTCATNGMRSAGVFFTNIPYYWAYWVYWGSFWGALSLLLLGTTLLLSSPSYRKSVSLSDKMILSLDVWQPIRVTRPVQGDPRVESRRPLFLRMWSVAAHDRLSRFLLFSSIPVMTCFLGFTLAGRLGELRTPISILWYVAAAGVLFALAGIWTAVRRLATPTWRWVTVTVVIGFALTLCGIYGRLLIEAFRAELGVPVGVLDPSFLQVFEVSLKPVGTAIAVLVACGVLWLLVKNVYSAPLSWLFAISILLFPPAVVLAEYYDSVQLSGYVAVYAGPSVDRYLASTGGLRGQPGLQLEDVCVEYIGSQSLDIGGSWQLSGGEREAATYVGASNGRSYYLFSNPTATASSRSVSDPQLIRLLIGVPSNLMIESVLVDSHC